MIDITSNTGWLSSTLRIINIIQMLTQGHWLYESNLLMIPHIKKPTLSALNREIAKTDKLNSCNANTVAGMKYASFKHEHVLHTAFINVYGTSTAGEIMKSVKSLPWIEITMTLVDATQGTKIPVNLNQPKVVSLKTEEEYDFTFQFFKKGNEEKTIIQSPRFPKKKDDAWFLCLGSREDELIAIKRVQIQRKATSSLKIIAPSILGSFTYVVYFMSDSYLGLDQQYEIPVHVVK